MSACTTSAWSSLICPPRPSRRPAIRASGSPMPEASSSSVLYRPARILPSVVARNLWAWSPASSTPLRKVRFKLSEPNGLGPTRLPAGVEPLEEVPLSSLGAWSSAHSSEGELPGPARPLVSSAVSCSAVSGLGEWVGSSSGAGCLNVSSPSPRGARASGGGISGASGPSWSSSGGIGGDFLDSIRVVVAGGVVGGLRGRLGGGRGVSRRPLAVHRQRAALVPARALLRGAARGALGFGQVALGASAAHPHRAPWLAAHDWARYVMTWASGLADAPHPYRPPRRTRMAAAKVSATGYRERLEAAAEAVKDARDAWKLRVRQRNALVVEAVDHGMSHRAAASAAGIKSTGTLTSILADSQPDDEGE